MPSLLAMAVILLLVLMNKMQERQIKKVNRMLKQAEKRESDIRELARKTNKTSLDVFDAAKKFVHTNAQMLGQLEAAYRALDAVIYDRDNLKAHLDSERTKNAIQDVHLDILQRRNDGTDREA